MTAMDHSSKLKKARKQRQVRTHTFNGRKYKIDIGDGHTDGLCDQYATGDSRYLVSMAAPHTRNELITIIHESLHASNWAETESVVDRVSDEIGRLLWRLGYKRP